MSLGTKSTKLTLEKTNANDTKAVVTKILCKSGSQVSQGQRLFDIEDSKAVQEWTAPTNGYIKHQLSVGLELTYGSIIATILETEIETSPTPTEMFPIPSEECDLLISNKAKSIIANSDIDVNSLPRGFITADVVLAHIERNTPPPVAEPNPANKLELPSYKAAERHRLENGAGHSTLSHIGLVLCHSKLTRAECGFFTSKITDLVTYCASRLLQTFPDLNSYFYNDHIIRHDEINAGVALDDGKRLLVLSIRSSNNLTLKQVQQHIFDGMKGYLRNSLTKSQISGATFTITDLTSKNTSWVSPLLPEGQALIIGLTKDGANYLLQAGFDHRVTSGFAVADFLEKLKSSILSELGRSATIACSYCDQIYDIAMFDKKPFLLESVTAYGQRALCCRTCWNGIADSELRENEFTNGL